MDGRVEAEIHDSNRSDCMKQKLSASLYKFSVSMKNIALLSRITSDPSICHGKPVVRGLRYPVENILELLASGMTHQQILEDYEDLEEEDLFACLLPKT